MSSDSSPDSKRIRSRRSKKVYQTVIKLAPDRAGSDTSGVSIIDIDSKPIRSKLLGPKPKQKPKPKLKRKQSPSSHERFKSGSDFKTVSGDNFKVAKQYEEALIQRMEWLPVKSRTRWKCVRCGWCCSHEWRVNLTWPEYDRLKDKLPIEEVVVDKKTGMSHPLFTIKNKCVQYDPKSHKCKIYKERAYSCATFPFSLTPSGELVRSKFCKGFGNGDVVEAEKMIRYIHKWRKRAGMKV